MTTDPLELEMESVLGVLEKEDPASDTYTAAAKNFAILNSCKIERDKLKVEEERINAQAETERINKEREIHQKKKELRFQIIKLVIVGGCTVGIAVLTIAGEQTRILNSRVGQVATKVLNVI